ncbi:MAG TPA: hypothetical protein DCG57_16100 [Candidatus Riflebacteria bacterium]|jgi:hypothetical protein|nr:hypothetical protein [Candidatus Riflebacteria bacterium]
MITETVEGEAFMKKIVKVIIVLLLAPLSAFAGLAVPGEFSPILASESFELNGQKMIVEKYMADQAITLRVSDADGKQIFTSEVLGSEEKKFVIDRQALSLTVRDLNGDNNPELITAAFYGPASGLYIFTYDAASKQFKPMQFIHPEADLTRDFMVSDMRQENGEDLMFLSNDVVRALGMIYSADPEVEAVAGFYFYKLAEGTFKFVESKPVPVDE